MSKANLTRRGVLSGALAAGGTAAVSGVPRPAAASETAITQIPDWSRILGEGVDTRPYGLPSEFEAHVKRRHVNWLTATRESSVNFTPLHQLDGIITPNGLCFERHHSGVARIDPAEHRLMINGLVETPLVFTLDDIKRFPRTSRACFLECTSNSGMEWRGPQLNGCQYTHGMVHCVMYTGVMLEDVLAEAGLKTNARWLMAEGADASGMNRSVPLEKGLDDCMIAFAMNGEALRPEQGYPLRLVVPGWEGNMWIKWLRRIEVGDQPWHTCEETSRYTDLMADGSARRFTWIMDCKSVVTNPSPRTSALRKGHNVLSGLAWSGHGTIDRVDVTFDGGRNWRAARLDGPSWDKALHRFYMEFDWHGEPMLIQSRAIDSAGHVQPTRDALRKIRGTNSIYHNNGIQTWHVTANGEAENVEIR